MPNISELTRLEEERVYVLGRLQRAVELRMPKQKKEELLRELRALDRVLGTNSMGDYNKSA